MKIVINGAGIAGPTLAFWLLKSGHEVLLIEEALKLRSGGYVIDFWGIGYDIAEKMGLIPSLLDVGYQVAEVRLVDRHGKKSGGFRADVFRRMTGGRYTSLRRSDLAWTIYEALGGRVETIFGDSISVIEDQGDQVLVHFEHDGSRQADLVIGADGLHSRIRSLVFGPDQNYQKLLGYHVAAFEIQGYRPRDELVYVSHGVPGKQISRFSMRDDKTLFLFVFRDEYLPGRNMPDDAVHKSVIKDVFANVEWECPRILEAMESTNEIYFDSISQIRMKSWSKNRTALIGDAAACVSLLAGEGSGLAIAEAYVLAGELHRCGGNHKEAFARYESLMKPFLHEKQQAALNFASSFAPETALGLKVRNLTTSLFKIPYVADLLIGRNLRDDIELPDYGF